MRCSLRFLPAVFAVGLAFATASQLIGQVELFISYQDNPGGFTGYVGRYDQNGTAVDAHYVTLDGATGVAVSSSGTLYAATPSSTDYGTAVMSYATSQASPAGTPFVTYIDDNSLVNPAGLALSASGSLYIAEKSAGTILVYNSSGTRTATLGDMSLGTPDTLVFDSTGNLYVSDVGNGNVLRYSGGTFTQINTNPISGLSQGGLALGTDGNLYVSSSSALLRVNLSTGATEVVQDFSSSLFQPGALAIASDGSLYLSGFDGDTAQGEVFKYTANGTGTGSLLINLGSGAYPAYLTLATAVPEPSTWALIAGAVILPVVIVRRRRLVSRKATA